MNTVALRTTRELSADLIARLRQRLTQSIGLEATLLGGDAVGYAVRCRMTALGLTAACQYEQLVAESAQEWTEMLEALLVSETWFFRELDAFKNLASLVVSHWAPANQDSPLRLLSVPCASGEEPFSMVMALLDAGFPQRCFHVDAADLSSPALTQAQTGVYGNRSFRAADLSFRNRYFQPVSGGFLLAQRVREGVRFLRGNLLQDDFLAGCGPYDFVFCRNLLIYLHEEARRQALAKLKCLLAPNGLLFVGLAEQLLARDHGLMPVGPGLTAPLVRSSTGEMSSTCGYRANLRRPVTALGPILPSRIGGPPVTDKSGRQNVSIARRNSRPAHLPGDSLEEARRLADAGKLGEAAALCRARLREEETSAKAYYLLGLVREASGEPGAAECYRKALYLEPNHHEALLHMAQLARNAGDLPAAHLFRARAERSRPIIFQP
jgi:chemotaxis protein methyltransferase WspC